MLLPPEKKLVPTQLSTWIPFSSVSQFKAAAVNVHTGVSLCLTVCLTAMQQSHHLQSLTRRLCFGLLNFDPRLSLREWVKRKELISHPLGSYNHWYFDAGGQSVSEAAAADWTHGLTLTAWTRAKAKGSPAVSNRASSAAQWQGNNFLPLSYTCTLLFLEWVNNVEALSYALPEANQSQTR